MSTKCRWMKSGQQIRTMKKLSQTQVKVRHRLFIASIGVAKKYRNGTGQIQIWEDIAISDVEQEQRDIKDNLADLESTCYPLGKHLGCFNVLQNRRQEF